MQEKERGESGGGAISKTGVVENAQQKGANGPQGLQAPAGKAHNPWASAPEGKVTICRFGTDRFYQKNEAQTSSDVEMEPCGGESPPSHHGKKVAELKTRLRSYREVTLKGDAHQVQGKGPQRGLKRPHEDEKEGTPPRKRRRKDAAPRQEGTYPKKTQWELGVVWDGSEKCDAKFNNQRASKGEVVVEGPSFKRTRMEKEPDREAAATQLVTAFAPSRKRPAQGMAERAAAGNQAPGRALPSLIPRGLTRAEHLKECRSINLRIKLLERALPRKIRYLVKK